MESNWEAFHASAVLSHAGHACFDKSLVTTTAVASTAQCLVPPGSRGSLETEQVEFGVLVFLGFN